MHTIAGRAVRQALLFALATSVALAPDSALAGKQDKTEPSRSLLAKAAKTKVVLGAFVGTKAEEMRKWTTTGLKKADNVQLVEDEAAASVAPGSSDSDYASVAAGSGAAAVVLGKVNLQKKVGWSLTLWVHDGSNGKLIEKLTVRGGLLPEMKKKLENKIGAILAPALKKAGKDDGGGAAAPVAATAAAAAPEAKAEPEAKPEAEAKPKPSTEGAEEVTLEEEPEGASMDGEETPPDDEAEAAATTTATGPSPLELKLGLRFYKRDFVYSDTLNDYDPAYERPLEHNTAAGSPMLIFSANLYPAAFFTDNFLANIGVMFGYEQGFLTTTYLPDPYENPPPTPDVEGRDLDQSHTDVYLGLRYRLMFGAHEIAPYATFGKHSFVIYDDLYPYYYPGTTTFDDYYDALPNVGYEYIDLGVQPRFQFGEFSVGGRAAYRIVNDTGGLQQAGPPDQPYDTWFPNAKGSAVSAGVQLGYAITPIFEILVGGDFTRYGFDFNHIPTTEERTAAGLPEIPVARVAGGATDTYLSGWIALGIRFSGSELTVSAGGGGSSDSSDSADSADDSDSSDSEVEDPDNEDVEELDF